MKRIAAAFALLTVLTVGGRASADPVVLVNGPDILKLGPIDIHGRDLRPHVVTEVSKLPTHLTATTLATQPFAAKIEDASKASPF